MARNTKGTMVCATRTKAYTDAICKDTDFSCKMEYDFGTEQKTVEAPCECTLSDNTVRVCPLPTDAAEYQNAKTAYKSHIADYAPKMHTTMKTTWLNKTLAIDFLNATKYGELYKADECLIESMIQINYKLPVASGINSTVNKLMLLFVLVSLL